MKPHVNIILLELQDLISTVQTIGNDDINDEQKYVLSKKTAALTESIRRKYGLTTLYYFNCEVNARENYNKLYGVDD